MPVVSVARQPDYRDLDLDFVKNPGTGDVAKKKGEEAIKRSVRNLVLTNFYERPFRSYIGSNAQKLLFENITPLIATYIENAIVEVISNFEPRVGLRTVDVTVSPERNGYDATISYVINNQPTITTISLFLERVR